MPYFKDISIAYKTLKEGLKLTFAHLKDATQSREPLGVEEENYFDQQKGLFTTQYPYESLPVPDNGRYRLDNEIEDCIVCDKCAKICPVNCIDIEPVKAVEEFGKTSDGTPKRLYAAKFDIDMAKCCFCGLCTTVCPTECLTMTKAYDFSEFEVKLHNYAFGNMNEAEITSKKEEAEAYSKKKEEEKLAKQKETEASVKPASARPKFIPKVKPATLKQEDKEDSDGSAAVEQAKPKFKPKIKPKVIENVKEEESQSDDIASTEAKPKPKFRPKIKPKIDAKKTDEPVKTEEPNKEGDESDSNPKPKFRPKPIIKKKKD